MNDLPEDERERTTQPPSVPRKDDAQKQDQDASTKKKVEPPPAKKSEGPDLATRTKAWVTKNPDPFIGGGIAALYVAWLLATARSLGFSRDEGFYFTAAYDYKRWFAMLVDSPSKAIERTAIDPIWQNNHEHPSLMKSLFAISHTLFHEKWKIFEDDSTAFRFPGMLMMGLALFVTYMFAARAYSRRAGVIAAITLGLMPRVFYHAHLACFDVPIMAMWTTCIYVYWRSEKEGGLNWAILAGVVYGLTLETKHNAWMLPAVFLPHALMVHGRAISRHAAKSSRIPVPTSLVAMAVIGPAIFLLLWPWLWNDTLPRIQEYVNFHVHHDYYNIEFLGRTYFGPPSPRSYMPVMIAATVPTISLVLFAIGAFDRGRVLFARLAWWLGQAWGRALPWPKEAPERDRVQTDLLVFLAIAVALGPFLLPRTPIFGGTKHWITAYPFLAILAGRGFDLVWTRLALLLAQRTTLDATKRFAAQAVVVLACFGGAFATTVHSHPFGLSAYVPIVGGTAGGADLGLNRQFWGFTTESLGPWLAENAKPGETLYFMDTAWPSWQRLIAEKRIPESLRGVSSPAEAELSIVHHEQHINEVDYNIWTEYRSSTPAYVLTHDGVPIITVYRRAHGRR
ncbi:MAG TPA: glycosyltransferase family 39 protein [Labilithrix sp.]|nr:glycosyltransferase family 39 protein [Labilithrix sp.]